MFSSLASLLTFLAIAPLLQGVATRTKSALTGRRGPPVLQPYADLWKLARRGTVVSATTTWIFRLVPPAVAACAVIAATLLPLDGHAALLRFSGDAIAFVYLLALGRFLLALAALDTGSSFEGMGASREVTVAAFVEMGFFVVLGVLSLATGELSLTGMLTGTTGDRLWSAAPSLVMVVLGLFALLLAESARVPVDDPATHLELTMIHEVMVLDQSGPDLALVLFASAAKFAAYAAILVSLLVPRSSMPWPLALGVLVAGLTGVAVAVGVVESTMARLRLPKVPLYLAGATALAGFGLVLLLR
ncbi:MAG TPA: NADH-quinone oxidoreductase subunit H [Gemmatimonadaceae bacterium]|nr:NADH-quinone oxidoreductase subunit H [Gemmatimonadaceae bacterium]